MIDIWKVANLQSFLCCIAFFFAITCVYSFGNADGGGITLRIAATRIIAAAVVAHIFLYAYDDNLI
jgi:hypothetical protein